MSNQSERTNTFQSLNINVNYILTFLFLFIVIIGILGNILVIISVEFDARMRRSLTNQLIVRVASCDFLILLFNIPDLIQFVSSNDGNWILNEFSCKFIRTTLVLAQYASVLMMCALTIERFVFKIVSHDESFFLFSQNRFIGIVYPLRSKFLRERKHVVYITLIVWLISILSASPNLIFLRVLTNPMSARRHCQLIYALEDMKQSRQRYMIHKMIESIVFYFVPLLLQIYCYTRISQRLFHVDESLQTSFHTVGKLSIQRAKVNDVLCARISERERNDCCVQGEMADEDEHIDLDENSSTKSSRLDSISQSSTRRSQRLSHVNNNFYSNLPVQRQAFISPVTVRRTAITYNALKSRRNVIKMLVIVVLIYFISFSPQVLVFLLFDTSIIENVPSFIQTPYFIAFTMLLVTISSASNPIVYAIFCSKFRQSFLKVFRKIFCCCCQNRFNYHPSQRASSLQHLPATTYRFNQRIIINGKK